MKVSGSGRYGMRKLLSRFSCMYQSARARRVSNGAIISSLEKCRGRSVGGARGIHRRHILDFRKGAGSDASVVMGLVVRVGAASVGFPVFPGDSRRKDRSTSRKKKAT